MSKKLLFSWIILGVISMWSLRAGEILDASGYKSITGFQGVFNEVERVFKVTIPRTEPKVWVDGLPLDPFMGLSSWVAFSQTDKNTFVMMGDLVLLEDEVNPVLTSLLNDNIDVTALHNHFFHDQPKVYFMHICGIGSLAPLSEGAQRALSLSREIRLGKESETTSGPKRPATNSIMLSSLEGIFGSKGQNKDGMAKFVFGRAAAVKGLIVRQEMGINTWAAFGGSDDHAVVDGDFCVFESELQPVLKALRKGDINIVAIHNHLTEESPRILFLHYWGNGRAEDLAHTIKEALDNTRS